MYAMSGNPSQTAGSESLSVRAGRFTFTRLSGRGAVGLKSTWEIDEAQVELSPAVTMEKEVRWT